MPSKNVERDRPTNAIFTDGAKRSAPLAIHPDAIGVSYPVRKAEEISSIENGIAIMCIEGPLEHKGGGWWSYWESYEGLAGDFKNVLDDPAVRAVVLKFDSPGGEVSGLNETVAIMQDMKAASGKPVYAYVDEACYSAAYALAMVADEIYMPESAGVGSIGVITAMVDTTKMHEKQGVRVEVIASGSKKTDGHPCVPLTSAAIKRTQRVVDKLAASFFQIVSAGRGLSTETIASYQAGTFTGQSAVDAGLADGVMSLKECLTFASESFSSQSHDPTDRLGEGTEPMPVAKLAAAKAVADAKSTLALANKAFAAAKGASAIALCAARVVAAEGELAKVTKTKTVTTDTHEEEVDDGEEEKAEEDAPPADDDDDEPADEEDDTDAKKASASVASTGSRSTKDSLLALARKITGKRSIDEVMGALNATWQSAKQTHGLAAEVAQLKADAEATKITAMIAGGMKAGKIAPSQRDWARTQSASALKAYLDAAPQMVTPVDGARKPLAEGEVMTKFGSYKMTESETKMCIEKGVDPAKYAESRASMLGSNTNGKA